MGLTVVLLDVDINKKTKDEGLAIDKDTTNIVIGDTLIKDMAGNAITPIIGGNAQKAAAYTPDTTRPELQTFDLNMDTGVITLHFLETMDVSTLRVDFLTLQTTSNAADASTKVTFSNAAVTIGDEDGLTIEIHVTETELNELKARCACSTEILHSRGEPLVPTLLLRLKRCHACGQWHSSRVSTTSYRFTP
jgi:hypothetical protein